MRPLIERQYAASLAIRRHWWDRLKRAEAELAAVRAERDELRRLLLAVAGRVADQSELLTRRAEK